MCYMFIIDAHSIEGSVPHKICHLNLALSIFQFFTDSNSHCSQTVLSDEPLSGICHTLSVIGTVGAHLTVFLLNFGILCTAGNLVQYISFFFHRSFFGCHYLPGGRNKNTWLV